MYNIEQTRQQYLSLAVDRNQSIPSMTIDVFYIETTLLGTTIDSMKRTSL